MFVCYIPAFNRSYAYALIPCARYAHKFSFRKNTKKIPHLQEMQDFFFTNNRYFAPIANCTMRVAHVLFFALAVLLAPFVCFRLPQYSRAYLVTALGSTSIHM